MVLIGAITVVRGILLFITQLVSAIVAAALVSVLFTGGLNVSTTLNSTTSLAQGTVIEMLLTAQLVFTIFMLAAEKHAGTFIAPVGIGLSLFIAELTGEYHNKWLYLIIIIANQHRRLLDRRLSQPSPLLRARSCSPLLRFLPLDLLGRAYGWLAASCHDVQAYQGARI